MARPPLDIERLKANNSAETYPLLNIELMLSNNRPEELQCLYRTELEMQKVPRSSPSNINIEKGHGRNWLL